MYFIKEMPPESAALIQRMSAQVRGFLAPIPFRVEKISSSQSPFGVDLANEYLFRLSDGNLALKYRDRTLAMLEEGDLFGFDRLSGVSLFSLSSEFAVAVEMYRFDDVFNHCATAPAITQSWSEILAMTQSLYQLAVYSGSSDESDPMPAVKQFPAGSDIIVQGTRTTDIFTLIEGHADVLVDGKKVGEVLSDEIFGAMAAFSNTARNATVRATKSCVVLSLPAQQFIGLMSSRPATVLKLISDMARALVSANKALITKL